MRFQRRIALLTGAAVAIAFIVASALAYLTISGQLHRQLDASLRTRADQVREATRRSDRQQIDTSAAALSPRRGSSDFYGQIVDADGQVERGTMPQSLPVGARARAVAAGDAAAYFADVQVDGDQVRLLVTPFPGGRALLTGRSLSEVQAALDRIGLILLAVAMAGTLASAALGLLVARRVTAPLRRLTATAERIATTADPGGERIDHTADDEIGRLAGRFNAMLDTLQATMRALDRSLRAQWRLVADASHELRTPITSLRTNIENLQANPRIDPARRALLLDRAAAQTAELAQLMNDLIDLARGDEPEPADERVRVDELVDEAIGRAARHAPAQRFDAALEETTVSGSPTRLMHALNNLLDNAVAWTEPGTPIEVRLYDGRLTVRDHGPGFAPDELAHVFGRFFRGAGARSRPGSGLGLAIVRQVAEQHGGSVTAANAPGGGAVVTLALPTC